MPYLKAHLETNQINVVTLQVGVPLKIARRAVNEHGDEENTVEIRDWRRIANDKAPGEAHDPVGHIVLGFKVNR